MDNQSLGTIREFNTRNFRVVVEAEEDWDVDLSFDETGRVRKQLESGELVAFQVAARVYFQGDEIGADHLGGCIYKNIEAFQDHRECGQENRKRIKQEGRFQIYRKARPHEHCLSNSDKLKKRGLATRERAEAWARTNATEPWEIFESGKCGSYFADMISEAIKEARKRLVKMRDVRVRVVA